MRSLSDLVIVTWNVSAAEALSANFEFILREHLIIALTELDKLTDITARKLNLNNYQTENVKTESSYIDKIFLKAKINKKNLRRKLRKALGEGMTTARRGGIHRDKYCHEVFAKAQSFTKNTRQTNGIDLLKAVLTYPTENIKKVLKEQKKTVSDLLKTADEIERKAREQNPEIFKPKPYIAPLGIDKVLAASTNLTELASQGRITQCVGRRDEIKKIVNILKRKTGRKNALLVGEKGIGKTAIIKTIALMIYKRDVAQVLEDSTIIYISPEKAQGAKFTEIINQLRAKNEIIVYLENINETGKELIREISKEAKSGNLHIVASASNIENLPKKVLSDIFETMQITQMPDAQVLEVLKQKKPDYELRYNLKITHPALNAAVNLSKRFKLKGVFPEKALRVLEDTCKQISLPAEKQNETVLSEIMYAAKKFNLELQPDINEVWIAHAVSQITGRNILQVAGYLASSAILRFTEMKLDLQKKVLGQEKAIHKICKCLKDAFSSATRRNPVMFLFAGPRGVGKTEVARHIPHYLFGENCQAVFFDMKQFNTNERIKRLFGSAGEEGILTQISSENPFQVFLFENIEHCARSFYNEFRAFIRNSDLSRSVFIMTTAAVAFAWNDVKYFSEDKIIARAIKKLRLIFPKGFLEKIENIVMFKSIGEKESAKLMTDWIDEKRAEIFERYGVRIRVLPSVEKALVLQGVGREFGVRRLRLIFEDLFSQVIEKHTERGLILTSKNWQFKITDNRPLLEPISTTKK